MAFMLGAFTSGLASGAQNGMKLYAQYEDLKSKKDLSDSLTKAQKSDAKGTAAPAGATPGAAIAGAGTGDTNFLGGAQSDSAASAPKQTPDLNADPRRKAVGAALETAGTDLKNYGDGQATMPNPSGSPNPYGNAKSDSAASAPQPDQAAQWGTPSPTGDTAMPVPQSAMPTQAQARSSQVFGSSVADWITGANPQNRAVHLSPTMGVQMGPGPARTPMSTSPGGRQPPPQYLPPQRPMPLAAAPTAGSPSLANQQTPVGAAIQTQYGNGGQ